MSDVLDETKEPQKVELVFDNSEHIDVNKEIVEQIQSLCKSQVLLSQQQEKMMEIVSGHQNYITQMVNVINMQSELMNELNIQVKDIAYKFNNLIDVSNQQSMTINALNQQIGNVQRKLYDMEIVNHYTDDGVRDVVQSIHQVQQEMQDLRYRIDNIKIYQNPNSNGFGGW